jgi:hypothetical protein
MICSEQKKRTQEHDIFETNGWPYLVSTFLHYSNMYDVRLRKNKAFAQIKFLRARICLLTKRITAVSKLQSFGLIVDQILNLCKFLEKLGHNISFESIAANLNKYESVNMVP